ncbi:MAG: haloacid dehalogenase-like hydrolase [Nannocystaceae bacterium]|nr:haloacid dehalogenase-like hydrolase [Nannocystaceae bacterium]
MSATHTAAFFRAEGVLVSSGVMHAAMFMAGQRAGMRERALRFGQALASVPVFGLLGQNDRTLGNRVAHLCYRDMTEDRVVVLAEEYVEDVLLEKVLDSGVELLRKAKADGHRVVVLSEGIGEIMHRLRERLRYVDDLICNALEYRDGKATGKLREPVIGGYEGGKWLKQYAAEHDLDLSRSFAYGTHGPDLLLLSAVGHPCAVNPDPTLRKAAREADWPVMDYSA